MRRMVLLAMVLAATSLGCSVDPLAPFQAPPEVSIAVQSAIARPYHATIIWSVENGSTAPYLIERRNGTEPWKRLTHLSITDGRLVLEDISVQPGQRYSYRVRIETAATSIAVGEVTVDVPR